MRCLITSTIDLVSHACCPPGNSDHPALLQQEPWEVGLARTRESRCFHLVIFHLLTPARSVAVNSSSLLDSELSQSLFHYRTPLWQLLLTNLTVLAPWNKVSLTAGTQGRLCHDVVVIILNGSYLKSSQCKRGTLSHFCLIESVNPPSERYPTCTRRK